MKCMNRINAVIAGGLLGFTASLPAQDIDLFLQTQGDAARPNVLFVIDNSANWNGQPEADTRAALKAVLVEEPEDETRSLRNRISVGLMPFSASNNPRGAKVSAHVRVLDAAYQGELDAIITDGASFEGRALEGTNNAPYAMSMNEAYRYFRGLSPASGLADGDHDPAAVSGGNYVSPAAGNCGRNHIVVIGHGAPDSGENNTAESALDALGGVLSSDPIGLDPDQFEDNWADEYARFMSGAKVVPDAIRVGNQEVNTHVIDVHDPDNTNRRARSQRAWFRSIAREGDGKYVTAQDADSIREALTSILQELLAVDSVFAASTLPVSVNVRGTNLNQVYMGVFRPDGDNRPRWMGNLKLYQLAQDEDGVVFLADRDGDPAQSASTGFITSSARSFWTTPSTFWEFDPRGTPPSGSDSPDGEVVEKGGSAQRQRQQYDTNLKIDGRQVFTCTEGCGAGNSLSATRFDTDNAAITETALGVDSSAERAALIDWVRGKNNVDDEEDIDSQSPSAIRPTMHGDVLHSRPAVINFGDDEDEVYIFYGANDGHLRALKGGTADTDGYELWSFIPEEFFGDLKALRDNPTPPSGERGKKYFADGSIGTFRESTDSGETVRIYVGMRRGGRFIYALDVSDPEDPRYLWRRSPEDAGFGELGQTWSNVTGTRYRDVDGNIIPVAVFGAGYDAEVEDQGYTTDARTMGRGIFVVDAETGELIWRAGPEPGTDGPGVKLTVPDMTHSIPSDLMVLDTTGNGRGDRIYTGDTGGNVWRVDMHAADPADWEVHHLADLGDDQKFLHRPDVVLSGTSDRDFDAVLIGAGNREDPFDRDVVNNFFMLKDYATGPIPPGGTVTTLTREDLFDVTDNAIQDGDEEEQQIAQAGLDNADGWFMTLDNAGEKVVSGNATLDGAVFFNTNQPPLPAEERDDDNCESLLGTARGYTIDFLSAAAVRGGDQASKDSRATEIPGGGLPPSPVQAMVEIDGELREVVITGTEVNPGSGETVGRRHQVWWTRESPGT